MCLFPNISYMILYICIKKHKQIIQIHPNTIKYPSKYWCFPLNPHLPTHSRSCSSYNEVMTPRRWATSARGGCRSHFCRATTGERKRLEPNFKMQFSWSCMYFQFQYLYFSRCNYLACALQAHGCLWIFSWIFIDFIVQNDLPCPTWSRLSRSPRSPRSPRSWSQGPRARHQLLVYQRKTAISPQNWSNVIDWDWDL